MEFIATLGLALLINVFMFTLVYPRQTDKFTDITYSLTFIAIALMGYQFSAKSTVSHILVLMIGLWAVRLGAFLGRRIHKIGRDKRFDNIRPNFWEFGRFWTLQGLSVWIVMIPPIYLLSQAPGSFKVLSLGGIFLWLSGLVIETISDNQKFAFSNNPENKDKWIESGLWKYSRHPNYLGEMMLWIGIYLFTLPYLSVWQAVIALASPLWICGLLLFVTGIPTTEKRADKKWGKIPVYQKYKEKVPILIPRL